MKKYIFFDFDGTIVDCQKFQIERLKNVFKKYNVDIENIDFLTLIGPPLYNTFLKYMGKDKAQEVLEYYNNSFNPQNIDNIYLFDGVKEMLQNLKTQGYVLCLTSLQLYSVVEPELKYLGILDYFDYIFCDDVERAYKSKVDLIADVISKNNIDKNNVVVVGDTINDVLGGTKNNLYTIGVNWGYGKIKKEQVSAVVKSPNELLTHILNLK